MGPLYAAMGRWLPGCYPAGTAPALRWAASTATRRHPSTMARARRYALPKSRREWETVKPGRGARASVIGPWPQSAGTENGPQVGTAA